jgi:diketogulonate reductase-like aldo/keto reductase
VLLGLKKLVGLKPIFQDGTMTLLGMF